MTGSLLLVGDPSTGLEAATKQYVDNIAQGLSAKASCVAGTTADITLSGLQVIDGVSVIALDRVLVKNQTIGSENGIYVVDAGAWTRSTDMDSGTEANSAFVFITAGTTQTNTGWVQTETNPVIGTDPLVFTQFSGAGTYTADGQGLILTGSQFSLDLDGSTLTKSVSGLKVSSGGITNTEVNAAANIAYSKLNLSNSIVNADVNASAAIAYSKLNLSSSIVNSDVNASAAIVYSKLNLSNGIVNADVNTSAAIAYSKLNLIGGIVNADVNASAAIVYSKLSLANSIVDADINASAAIARSKIAAGSVNHVVINDGSGNLSSEATLAISRGGTGSSTQNFVDLTTQQSISGAKTLVPVILTDAVTIATDAALGNFFQATLGGNRTLGAPTNPTDGQKIVYKFVQDGTGGRTLAFNAIFNFGTFPTLVLSGAPGKVDYMGVIYNGTTSLWDVVAYSVAF